jgi:phage anti-repressor protein
MLKNSLKIFLLLLLTTVSACCFNNDRSNENTVVDVVPMISEWANQMNVFPIRFIANQSSGPINKKEGSPWFVRYELTFDQYELFYKLKYLAQTISQKELTNAITYLDKVTPKEKALILTMIYMYERTRRKPLDPIYTEGNDSLDAYAWYPPMFPILKTDKTVSQRQWKKWIGVLEQYSKDNAVAFPAITEDIMTLKEVWEKDQLRVLEMAKSLGMIDPVKEAERERRQAKIDEQAKEHAKLIEQGRVLGLDETRTLIVDVNVALDLDRTKEVRRKASIEDRKKIDALTEYIHTQYIHVRRSGLVPLYGNSSNYPKTVGDIVTQLLMSRLKYED